MKKTQCSSLEHWRKQLFTSWRIDCHYDCRLPHGDTMVTGLRLEIWLANPAGWNEILRLSEDQGKLCWGRGVNWSVTPLPIWMTSLTNKNHCFLLPHSPALHNSLVWRSLTPKTASGQLVHTNILVTLRHKMVARLYLPPVGLTDVHINSFLPRLREHIFFHNS